MHDAGIVEEYVQLAELLLGDGDHALTIRRIGDVRANVSGFSLLPLYHLCRLLAAFIVHIGHEYASALARKQQGSLATDAAGGACNQSNFILESHDRFVSLIGLLALDTILVSDPLEIPLAFPVRHCAIEGILFGLEEVRIVRHYLFSKCSLREVAIREMLDSVSQRLGNPVRIDCTIKIT
jgi:hypothetical protein